MEPSDAAGVQAYKGLGGGPRPRGRRLPCIRYGGTRTLAGRRRPRMRPLVELLRSASAVEWSALPATDTSLIDPVRRRGRGGVPPAGRKTNQAMVFQLAPRPCWVIARRRSDVSQEVFLRVFRTLARFRGGRDASGPGSLPHRRQPGAQPQQRSWTRPAAGRAGFAGGLRVRPRRAAGHESTGSRRTARAATSSRSACGRPSARCRSNSGRGPGAAGVPRHAVPGDRLLARRGRWVRSSLDSRAGAPRSANR